MRHATAHSARCNSKERNDLDIMIEKSQRIATINPNCCYHLNSV